MEKLRRREIDERPADPPPAAARNETGPEPAGEQMVNVIWGPLMDRLAVVGMTVAEVRTLLRGPFNIAPTATTYVNGRAVGQEHRLAASETLEFRRDFGEKG